MGEDGLKVFYVLQTSERRLGAGAARQGAAGVRAARRTRRRRDPRRLVTAGARSRGGGWTIAGPFAPGDTLVQVGYHVAVRRRGPDDRAAAAGAADAPAPWSRRRSASMQLSPPQMQRAADDAGQRQALHRAAAAAQWRRVSRCTFARSRACRITAVAARRRARARAAHPRRRRVVDRSRRRTSGRAVTDRRRRARGAGAIACSTSSLRLEGEQRAGPSSIPSTLRGAPARARGRPRTGLRRARRRGRGVAGVRRAERPQS